MARPRSDIRVGAARRLILSICGPLLLAGCKVGPDYEAPVTPTPERWVASAEPEATIQVERDTKAGLDLSRWWARLGDPQLTSLVEQAIQSNLGMRLAEARLREAIRAAERRVAAETARIGVEVTELFPRVSLLGTFGLQSADADDLIDADSLTWSFGPGVRWRLMEFGRIVSNISVQEERQQQALTLYYQSVLDALEQVEASLANYAAQRRRFTTLAEVNAVNQRAF